MIPWEVYSASTLHSLWIRDKKLLSLIKNLTYNSRFVMPLANLTPSPRFLLRERNLENANSRNSVTLINIEHLLHLKATAAPRIVGNILHFSLQIFFCLLFAAIFLSKFRRKLISLLQLQYFVANKWSRLSLHPYDDHFMNKMFGLKVCRYKSPTG